MRIPLTHLKLIAPEHTAPADMPTRGVKRVLPEELDERATVDPEVKADLAKAWDAWRDKPSWDKRGQPAWYASDKVKALLGLKAGDRIPQWVKRLKRRDLREAKDDTREIAQALLKTFVRRSDLLAWLDYTSLDLLMYRQPHFANRSMKQSKRELLAGVLAILAQGDKRAHIMREFRQSAYPLLKRVGMNESEETPKAELVEAGRRYLGGGRAIYSLRTARGLKPVDSHFYETQNITWGQAEWLIQYLQLQGGDRDFYAVVRETDGRVMPQFAGRAVQPPRIR